MEIEYNKEMDIKYVQIKKGEVAYTKEHKSWFLIDCNDKDEILGVEILNSSKHHVALMAVGDRLLFSAEMTLSVNKKDMKPAELTSIPSPLVGIPKELIFDLSKQVR